MAILGLAAHIKPILVPDLGGVDLKTNPFIIVREASSDFNRFILIVIARKLNFYSVAALVWFEPGRARAREQEILVLRPTAALACPSYDQRFGEKRARSNYCTSGAGILPQIRTYVLGIYEYLLVSRYSFEDVFCCFIR